MNYKTFSNYLKKKSINNGIWLYLLQFFNTVIPLITLPYITRILGPSEYGTFAIAINIIGYSRVVVEYGFGFSASREVAVSSEKKVMVNTKFSTILCSRLMLLLASMTISLGYGIAVDFSIRELTCLCILMTCLIGSTLQMNWAFQGTQDMKYISVISICGRIISTFLIFILVTSSDDLYLYCILYSVSPIISGILGVLVAKKLYNIRFVFPKPSVIVKEMKKGWYVFTSSLSAKAFGAIGITFLGLFTTRYEVGLFSAIQKIANMIVLIWSPISQVLYPISSEKFHDSFDSGSQFVKKIMRVLIIPFIALIIIIAIFAQPILSIAFGVEYADRYYWLYPLLLWVAVSILNNFTGVQTLLASGHDDLYSYCFNLSVIATIILNFFFVKCFRGFGAAFAPVLSESILGMLIMLALKRIKKAERK